MSFFDKINAVTFVAYIFTQQAYTARFNKCRVSIKCRGSDLLYE